ncbi:hypothetical protein DPX16_14498 [Anabarilius grahami]|uniref:Uncharacterized protein n=1 Tax=Anabarilius grahami TaxID=495550 RepID=A0A3N0YXD9_ANAGA|nr:hypothetical protein DPX16_14498 [Anabarilius grahami]
MLLSAIQDDRSISHDLSYRSTPKAAGDPTLVMHVCFKNTKPQLNDFIVHSKSPSLPHYLYWHSLWQCWSDPHAGPFEVIRPFRNYSHLIDPVGQDTTLMKATTPQAFVEASVEKHNICSPEQQQDPTLLRHVTNSLGLLHPTQFCPL